MSQHRLAYTSSQDWEGTRVLLGVPLQVEDVKVQMSTLNALELLYLELGCSQGGGDPEDSEEFLSS